ncbi:MAG: phospho-N-acetylmuramoyl-pentapeptide-transferase [Candidatus Saccharimonadales bacterium]
MHDIHLATLTTSLIQLVLLALAAFVLSVIMTPIYTGFAYRYRFWKRQRSTSTNGEALSVFTKLHASKFERNIPTMAGLIIVASVTIVTVLVNLDRQQTWLPLAALIGGGVVGLIDDIINIRGKKLGVAGLRSGIKFAMILAVAVVGAWFFYYKLGFHSIHVPFMTGQWELGWWVMPLFVLAVVSTSNAVNISDGLDGLAGGLAASAFTFYAAIALLQGNVGIAGFCFTILGALISYLWFNVYPARFFMGDVGSFALGTVLGVVAMLTNSILLLPIIGAMFVIEVASSAVQLLSKRFFHRRVMLSAPIHHHLEAIGWPETKVTMRFWLIANVTGFVGLLIALAGGHIA